MWVNPSRLVLGKLKFRFSSVLSRYIPNEIMVGCGSIASIYVNTGSMVCLESVRVMWGGITERDSCGKRPEGANWRNPVAGRESELIDSVVVLCGVSSEWGSVSCEFFERFRFSVCSDF